MVCSHKWEKETFIDWGDSSNAREYKQRCKLCGYTRRWMQAKDSDKKFNVRDNSQKEGIFSKIKKFFGFR